MKMLESNYVENTLAIIRKIMILSLSKEFYVLPPRSPAVIKVLELFQNLIE